jgi:hypothetical protein
MIDSAFVRTASGLRRLLGATAALRNQTNRTLDAVGLQQPEHLTPLKPQELPAASVVSRL